MVRYRAGAIGRTGRGNWGHGLDTAFVGVAGVEFVAVADDDPDGLRDAGERTGAGSLYGDYREMLERERLDFVAVCPRWVGARTEMVIAAAEAGVRGIFCEKPFAATLAEADAMLEACERSGTRVAVAHRRANPYEQRAKAMVEEGAIGELQSLRAMGKCDHRSGAEDLIVLGTHMMDSMRYV
ncbi:MAG: Gfo/Idh/MocA family oxidoreductase, partial [Dehalococcoidia bacterium]|nr:Gfo/Idh/MocA family oxidoreductase [Dehalococcoidia bacterium]